MEAYYSLDNYEYRYRQEGGVFTLWLPVTVKPIQLPNAAIAAGDVQVRIKAKGTRQAGKIYSSPLPFTANTVGGGGDDGGGDTGGNTPPVASAGADNVITLPTNSVVLQGSGTDSDGFIAGYNWEQLIGPNTASISNITFPDPTASGLIAGTYQFRLTVTDDDGATHQDTVQVTVNPAE
jgi:hypothetical protein